jgi:hypothetical protein
MALVRLPEVIENRLKETGRPAHMAVCQKRVCAIVAGLFDQSLTEQCLAGSGRAGEQQHTFLILEALGKLGKGMLVTGGGIITVGIRRGREWPPPQAEVRFIHDRPFPPSRARIVRNPSHVIDLL